MVGLCHWLAAGSLLHGLHPALDGVQDQHHPGDPQGGKTQPFVGNQTSWIPSEPGLKPANAMFFLLQRIQLLITPCDSLPKTKREQERLLAIFAPGGEATMTTNGYYPVPERDSNI